MKTINQTKENTNQATDDSAQAGKAGIIITCLAATSMGVWGVACMVGALASGGVGGIVTGFMTAVTGM